MAEIQRERLEPDTLENLAAFSPEIQNRVDEIRAGLSPNGEHPNGLLSQAIEGDDRDDKQKFMDEYSWVLYLAAHPHRDKEGRDVLMSAAEDGLFMAGETYDEEVEPNFLRHLGNTVTGYLEEVFGEAPSTDLPPAEAFEEFVISHYGATEEDVPATVEQPLAPRPPLANERLTEEFRVGRQVLYLLEGRLLNSQVTRVTAYDHSFLRRLPRDVSWQDLQDASLEVADREQKLSKPKRQALAKELAEGINPQLLRRVMLESPTWRNLLPSDGFVRLKPSGQPVGVITDINNNDIIPMDAWRLITSDEEYREDWLSSGSKESLRQRRTLEAAIAQRMVAEARHGTEFEAADSSIGQEREPRRARHFQKPHTVAYVLA